MPGIVGYSHTSKQTSVDDAPIVEMQELLAHRSEDVCSEPTRADDVTGASALHHPQPDPIAGSEYHGDDLDVWVDGELFGLKELGRTPASATNPGPAERLGKLYRERGGFDFLRRADGRFAFVLYDRRSDTVHFGTDRWGLKYIYLAEIDGEVVWSSELKGFLAYPDFEPAIDARSQKHFFRTDQFYGSESWFESVELVGPASVFSWDLREGTLERDRYWDWRELGQMSNPPSRSRAIRRMGELFDEAVRVRSADDRTFGIGLSGGLDSRAIIAALPEERREQSFGLTFGHPDSREVSMARRVAERAGLRHRVFEMDETNWLENRIRGVWLCDGQVPIHYLHSFVCLAWNPDPFEINLSGFLGGGIQGAAYIGGRRGLEETIETRGRRRIYNGLRSYDVYAHTRCPFLDRELLEYTLRLPREMLADGTLYHEMLLEHYPEYFRDIPDANTGRALGWSPVRKALYRALQDPARTVAGSVPGLADPPKDDFKDYSKWFGGPTYRDTFETLLFEEPRLYREYLPDLELRPVWERLCSGEGRSGDWELIDKAVTFEIWLEQVFEGRLRAGTSEL